MDNPHTTDLNIYVCCPDPSELIGFCGVGMTEKEARADMSCILKANFRPDKPGLVFSKTLKVKK